MGPEQKFVKIWRLRNEGTTAWPESTRLAFAGGDNLSTVESVAVPPTEPGQEIDVAIDMQSPSRAGRYVSYWRLSDAEGYRFGQRVWVDIIVVSSSPNREEGTQAVPLSQDEGTNTAALASHSVSVQTPPTPEPTPMQVEVPAVIPAMKLTPLVAAAPPVQPLIAAPLPVVQHSPQLQQLLDMGFSDVELLQTLLAGNNNDVLRTVQDLLNQVDPRNKRN